MSDYSWRPITHSEDELLAIAGVAALFTNGLSHCAYKAGLWLDKGEESSFFADLMWSQRQGVANEASTSDGGTNTVPSWSWASVMGETPWSRNGYDYDKRYKMDVPARLIACSVNLDSEDAPFGHVLGGTLRVSAPLKEFKAVLNDAFGTGCVAIDADVKSIDWAHSQYETFGVKVPNSNGLSDVSPIPGVNGVGIELVTVRAVLLLRSHGLLLLLVKGTEYRRIGMFSLIMDDRQWFTVENGCASGIIPQLTNSSYNIAAHQIPT
ncbi:MAG: hypothetical protein M1827_000580 [Pycnora praestabilis]|nr:MAG: hypothetical protein M1827_000580 [Pycnora praestabilis]